MVYFENYKDYITKLEIVNSHTNEGDLIPGHSNAVYHTNKDDIHKIAVLPLGDLAYNMGTYTDEREEDAKMAALAEQYKADPEATVEKIHEECDKLAETNLKGRLESIAKRETGWIYGYNNINFCSDMALTILHDEKLFNGLKNEIADIYEEATVTTVSLMAEANLKRMEDLFVKIDEPQSVPASVVLDGLEL